MEASQKDISTVSNKFSKISEMPLTEVLSACSSFSALQYIELLQKPFLAVQLGMYVLFAGEVYAWFCVGEIVGR